MAGGRPRTFDLDEALERAMEVFWRHGYEGATIPDLTAAMGINRPSLYAAFGNKEALFRKALQRYTEGPAAYVREALNEPTACAVVERLLNGAIDMATDPKNPRGCLAVQGALACAEAADSIRRELATRREAVQGELRQRFERAVQEGDLPETSDCGTLARYVTSVIHGIAVQAAGGVKRKELQKVAAMALRAWPA